MAADPLIELGNPTRDRSPEMWSPDHTIDRWWLDGLERWKATTSGELEHSLRALAEVRRVRSAAVRNSLAALVKPTAAVRAAMSGAIATRSRGIHLATPSAADSARFLEQAVHGLESDSPDDSSRHLIGSYGRRILILFAVVNVLAALLWPIQVFILWISVATAFYAATVIERVILYKRSLDDNAIDVVSDEEALALPDSELPTFSVMIPAYHEREVVEHLLRAVGGLDFPRDKLQVMLLLEEDDQETIDAASAVDLDFDVDLVTVPPAEPRTKPKALNYGLQLATGEIVTVYDAEDVPEPLQLRRAAVILQRYGDELACVQAQLSYSNTHQNIITKWFTLEYAIWFSLFLPGLVSSGAPVPLGGTSNHFRRAKLVELGAWDPYNVTEDADLGIRMHRKGYRTRVVQSVTLEEGNSDFVNWVKQRSRWYKGYLQTWIVNLRRPVELFRELGAKDFLRFNLFVGGTPLLGLLNPIFWALTILWFTAKPHFIKLLFPAPVFYVGLLCWAFGNFTIAYLWLIATRLTKRTDLLVAALLVPIYWVMMSVAAVKALVQLVLNPSYWEKTVHGLDARHRGGSKEAGRALEMAPR
jgi:cellulose synthase/poly-beta-1,6-N-acetylglucosamine synthase-like glycosyltransferase